MLAFLDASDHLEYIGVVLCPVDMRLSFYNYVKENIGYVHMHELSRKSRIKAIQRFEKCLQLHKDKVKLFSISTQFKSIISSKRGERKPSTLVRKKANKALAKSLLMFFQENKVSEYFIDDEFIVVFNEVNRYPRRHYLICLADIVAWIDNRQIKTGQYKGKRIDSMVAHLDIGEKVKSYYK